MRRFTFHRGKELMWSLYHKMETEYHNNPDEFSKSIILSHLDSILKYAQRFYKRQFIDRKPLTGMTVTKFNGCLGPILKRENPEKRIAYRERYGFPTSSVGKIFNRFIEGGDGENRFGVD